MGGICAQQFQMGAAGHWANAVVVRVMQNADGQVTIVVEAAKKKTADYLKSPTVDNKMKGQENDVKKYTAAVEAKNHFVKEMKDIKARNPKAAAAAAGFFDDNPDLFDCPHQAFSVGDKVNAEYAPKGGEFLYDATVAAKNADGTYTLNWTDKNVTDKSSHRKVEAGKVFKIAPGCPKGHLLDHYCVPVGRANVCDGDTAGCHRTIYPPEEIFRCKSCDYDLCHYCYPDFKEGKRISVRNAGGVGSKMNGIYRESGQMHNGKKVWKQVIPKGESIIYFNQYWKMNTSDNKGGWWYCVSDATGLNPPPGKWTSEGYSGTDAEPPPVVRSWMVAPKAK